jgi:hypothetical protein
MSLAELVEELAMSLPPDERRKLGAKLLASAESDRPAPKRRAGSAAGRVHLAEDFDASLEDLAELS